MAWKTWAIHEQWMQWQVCQLAFGFYQVMIVTRCYTHDMTHPVQYCRQPFLGHGQHLRHVVWNEDNLCRWSQTVNKKWCLLKAFCQQHGKPIPELEVKISKKGALSAVSINKWWTEKVTLGNSSCIRRYLKLFEAFRSTFLRYFWTRNPCEAIGRWIGVFCWVWTLESGPRTSTTTDLSIILRSCLTGVCPHDGL